MKRRMEDDRTVTYTGPDGKEYPGYIVDGHVYTDPEGTQQMPVGSSFTAADGQIWDMTAQGGVPAGQGGSQVWLARLRALWQELSNRTGPTYDPEEDPLWQRYVQTYQGLGRQAMEDARGRAAALTGGYGSSYAQTQGSQAYDAYLQLKADLEAERARMQKALEKARKDIEGQEKKLANENFVAHAPEAVVAEARRKLAENKEKVAQLEKLAKLFA